LSVPNPCAIVELVDRPPAREWEAGSDDRRAWLAALLERFEPMAPHAGSSGVAWTLIGLRHLIQETAEPLRPTDCLIMGGIVAHLFEAGMRQNAPGSAATSALADGYREVVAFIERCAWAAAIQAPRETSDPRVDRALRYLRAHFRRPDLTVIDVARDVGLTRPYLGRLLVQCTGRGFAGHLHDLRIRESRRLLVVTALSVKEVAAAVGYNDSTQFCRRFKRLCKSTPARFRRNAFKVKSKNQSADE
jgi:AraC-like DNA-binding protein